MDTSLSIIESFQRVEHHQDPSRASRAIQLRALYETMAEHLFHQYEPTKMASRSSSRAFMIRLNEWLSCFSSDEDRWAAFRSIEYLFFAGNEEFEELYRFAYENIVKPWVADRIELDIFAPDASVLLSNELECIWPCPITDSLKINSFLHITGLGGKGIRPDWYSLRLLADPHKIENYRNKQKIKYLLLLEDFSGSGMQVIKSLKFAAKNFNGPILLVPLLVCEPGDKLIRETISAMKNVDVSYSPVSIITEQCLIKETPAPGEPKLFSPLRSAIKSGFSSMTAKPDGGAFGWEDVGSLVALYSNCPNNTPPIYHFTCETWKPLFPRSVREFAI